MKTKEMLIVMREAGERNHEREQEWKEQQDESLLRMLLIDVQHGEAKIVRIKDDLDEFYRLIDCNTIDIVRRSIGGRTFEIICDDNGLFRSDCRTSAMDRHMNQQFVGNLLICRYGGNGELAGLTTSDVAHLAKYLRAVRKLHDPNETWPVLYNVEYC